MGKLANSVDSTLHAVVLTKVINNRGTTHKASCILSLTKLKDKRSVTPYGVFNSSVGIAKEEWRYFAI
jgi:hypothetical protein